jgi:hypothetical protein
LPLTFGEEAAVHFFCMILLQDFFGGKAESAHPQSEAQPLSRDRFRF